MRAKAGRIRSEGAARSEGHGISSTSEMGACDLFVGCGTKIWCVRETLLLPAAAPHLRVVTTARGPLARPHVFGRRAEYLSCTHKMTKKKLF